MTKSCLIESSNSFLSDFHSEFQFLGWSRLLCGSASSPHTAPLVRDIIIRANLFYLKSSLFLDVMQRRLAVSYRRFGPILSVLSSRFKQCADD